MGDVDEVLERCSNYDGVPLSFAESQQPFWKLLRLLNEKERLPRHKPDPRDSVSDPNKEHATSHRLDWETPPLVGNCGKPAVSIWERVVYLRDRRLRGGSVRKPRDPIWKRGLLWRCGAMAILEEANLLAESKRPEFPS